MLNVCQHWKMDVMGNCCAGDSCRKHQLCDKPSQLVTCESPSGAGVVLDGTGLADSWLHPTPLGWRQSLSLQFFADISLLYDSYIIRRNKAID